MTETGSGSAAELLSGSLPIALTMSSMLTDWNSVSETPVGAGLNVGSGAVASCISSNSVIFVSKELVELIDRYGKFKILLYFHGKFVDFTPRC
jgi:hypothetical protein